MAMIATLHAVMLEQVGEHLGISQIIDRHDLEFLICKDLAEGKPSDSAEPIDCNYNPSCDPPT